jgi:biopolymer transport protein ExbD
VGRGKITLRKRQAHSTALAATLDQATHGNRDERIFLRADRAVSYGNVMDLMNSLRAAGYLKVALVGLENRDTR